MSTWTMDRRVNWPMRRRIYKDGRTYERREQYKEQLQEKVHVCRLQHHFKVNYTFDQFSNVFDRLIKRNWQYGFKNIWYLQYSFGPFTNVHFVFQLPTTWTWRLHKLFFSKIKDSIRDKWNIIILILLSYTNKKCIKLIKFGNEILFFTF